VTASFSPAGAAEFPNDNPALHRGARWVCLAARGPARALWQATEASAASASPPATSVPGPVPALPPPPSVERHCEGPIELDLHRIVLPHRVENVPPPPDFIYRPFASSRARVTPAVESPRPIDPRPCRVVDARQAGQRVQRGWRVDVAPCVRVDVVAPCVHVEPARLREPVVERRLSRHRGGVVACPAPRLPSFESLVVELQAASA